MRYLPVITFIVLSSAFFISGCDPGPQSGWTKQTIDLTDVKGLEGCVFVSFDRGVSDYDVIRCPNSSTTTSYQQGKTTQSTTVVDHNVELPTQTQIEELSCVSVGDALYCKR